MEDKKYSFSNVTVRIYEGQLLKDASETYRRTENQFANSKSAFMVYFFKKGFYGDSTNGDVSSNADILTELKELRKSIDVLSDCLKAEKTNSTTNTKNYVEIQGSIIDLLLRIASELGLDGEAIKLKGD